MKTLFDISVKQKSTYLGYKKKKKKSTYQNRNQNISKWRTDKAGFGHTTICFPH